MKNETLNDLVEKRLQENTTLFTNRELAYIQQNRNCIKKVYLLGFIDAKQCYEK